MSDPRKLALCGDPIPVSLLDCEQAFKLLTDREKLYAHYISKASWAGAPVVLQQTSEESSHIFKFLLALFSVPDLKEKSTKNGVNEKDWNNFLNYSINFLGNMGNYLSFGDTKFIPRIEFRQLEQIVASSEDAKAQQLFRKAAPKIYSLDKHEIALNIPPVGISTYYSSNILESDIQKIQFFLDKEKISGYNTRLFKYADDQFEVRKASAKKTKSETFEFDGWFITVSNGDYQEEMARLVGYLEQAKEHAANDTQKKMMEQYIEHFQYGDINAHKASQRYWIHDKSPAVESNIGFIESYRDPFGVRGEFESFVSIVDKEASQRLQALVDGAPDFLKLLPWDTRYEKDTFLRPDFTSLCVLTFASSGIPAGINIPNYDDIRQTDGFKNVSLGNVLSASPSNLPLPFFNDQDADLYRKYKAPAFEVQVALHELLGHGSGKLFSVDENGKKNFPEDTINPITNQPVSSYYQHGETYDSKFLSLASAMEECRAECVGLYLSIYPDILKLFSVEAEPNVCCDITYVNWLSLIYAGLRALEFYSPEHKKWRQAHMQARHAITRVLLERSGVLSFDRNDKVLKINFNRELLLTEGFDALREFLNKIMVYKATADVVGANALFDKYTSVGDDMLSIRELVLENSQPRPVFVQPNTFLDETTKEIKFVQYPATPEGLIQSFLERKDLF